MASIRADQFEQPERIDQEASNDLENERTRQGTGRDRYRESEMKAVAEAAPLQGRLDAMEEPEFEGQPERKTS